MSLKSSASSHRISNEPPNGFQRRFEKFYVYILIIFMAYIVADLTILYLRPQMLPTDAPPEPPVQKVTSIRESLSNYAAIVKRNIFNKDGVIPEPLADEGSTKDKKPADQGVPVLSSLPLELKGTIVHRNPARSLATIIATGRTNAEATAFRAHEEISGLAKIIAIERRKVILKNLSSGRNEYIEIPQDKGVALGSKNASVSKSVVPSGSNEIKQTSSNQFSLKRSDITKYTNNLSSVLKQARMVPNLGAGGKVEGFRFVSIQPNSIYEKLGFKVGDIIKKVNNEPINSPSKAMTLYRELQKSDKVQIGIERDGRIEDNTYSISD